MLTGRDRLTENVENHTDRDVATLKDDLISRTIAEGAIQDRAVSRDDQEAGALRYEAIQSTDFKALAI